MTDFRIRVSAETKNAEDDLRKLDRTADRATRERKLEVKFPSIKDAYHSFTNLGDSIQSAANDIKQFYSVAKKLPGVGEDIKRFESAVTGTAKAANVAAQNTKAGDILANSFSKATNTLQGLVNNLAKLGFALFGIKEIAGVLQQAFGGFFDNTIGREIRLRETILKTQTTLASTSKIFKDGREITDPYQKIVSLTGAVRDNIDSIRERSIALAGVTSNDVIEVFGIVAAQISQVGGGLKEAEDLAINFAAALGTFGIPLYQARQEIGSILRGDITMDSYLAKSLGITNEDIAKAKTQAGGVVKFLEERLAAAVAGQKIAAQGFAGVLSNIADLWELVGQRFGAQLLDPLLNALTAVFERLFKIREQIFSIADEFGSFFSRVAAAGGLIAERVTSQRRPNASPENDASAKALNNVKDAVQDVSVMIESALQRSIGAVAQIINTLKPTVTLLVDAFIRLGKAFLEIKTSTFETLARVLANVVSVWSKLIELAAGLFNAYSRLLDLPIFQYFAELAATMNLLKRAGMDFITSAILIGRVLVTQVVPAIGATGTVIATLLGGIAAVIIAVGKLGLALAGLAAAFASLPVLAGGVATGLKQLADSLNQTGGQAMQAGTKVNQTAGAFRNMGEAAKLAGLNIIKSLGWIFLIQAGITLVVDAIGRYQKAAEETARLKRAELALTRLSTTYKNVGDDADYATRAARDFERQLAQGEYNRALERLEEIRKKLNDLRYEMERPGFQSWEEAGRALRQVLDGNSDPFADRTEVGKLIGEEARLRQFMRKYEAEQNKKSVEENIKIESDKRVNLEKEIRELRKQHEDQIFQQRQALAQKEVEIFRANGELRIFQMEQANKKLIEGEEGRSAEALEALNNYLSTRERGELEIEGAKKQLTIELSNLEKSISDYRLEMEKKIFDLRKRAGENDVKSAQLRKQQLEAQAKIVPGGRVKGGAVVTNRNDPDGEQTGSDIALKGGIGAAIQNPFSSLRITKVGQQGSGSGTTGRGFGKYVTAEAVLNGQKFEILLGHLNEIVVRVGDVLESGAVIGTQGITGRATGPHVSTHVNALNGGNAGAVLAAIEKSWVKGGTIESRSMGAAPKAQPLQDRQDIGDGTKEAQEYASAIRNVGDAMARLRSIQERLTNARTAAAFQEIARAAFPKVALEQYDDQLKEIELTMQGLAEVSANVYDPERLRIAVEQKTKEKIAEREKQEILKKAQEQLNKRELSQQEYNKLVADLNARQRKHNADLETERRKREQILQLTRQQTAIEELKKATGNIRFDVAQARVQGQAAMAEAYGGEDPIRRRLIEAEVRIAEYKIQLEKDQTDKTKDINAELAKFAAETRAAAIELGTIDKQVAQFKRTMDTIRQSSQIITEGYKGFAKALLTGGDTKEALNSMLTGFADQFLDMILDSAFKPMQDAMTENLKNLIFGDKDPLKDLQQQQVSELANNTEALKALTTAVNSGGTGSQGPVPIPTVPYQGGKGGTTPENGSGLSDTLTSKAFALDQELTQTTSAVSQVRSSAVNLPQAFSSLQRNIGGLITIFSSIGMGIAGAGQMKGGGTYNTLMGLAGIFGTVGSIAGMFTSGGLFGGLFGGGSKAAAGLGAASQSLSFNPSAFSMPLLTGRAKGGPVQARTPYIVGEEGPELFIPAFTGGIVPNDQIAFTGGEQVTEVAAMGGLKTPFQKGEDGRGSNAFQQGSSFNTSNAFTALYSTPIPFTKSTERLMSERSERETIAALNNPKPLDVRYESQKINGVEYVTVEQFQRGLSDAAERGRALTLGALKNSVKARRSVGI